MTSRSSYFLGSRYQILISCAEYVVLFLTTWLLLDSRSSTSVLSSLLQWVISPLYSLRMNSYSCLLTVPSATMWVIMNWEGYLGRKYWAYKHVCLYSDPDCDAVSWKDTVSYLLEIAQRVLSVYRLFSVIIVLGLITGTRYYDCRSSYGILFSSYYVPYFFSMKTDYGCTCITSRLLET